MIEISYKSLVGLKKKMEKVDYLKYCILYKGEKSLEDNPIEKDDDEFKWYMWRREYGAVRLAKEQTFANDDELEEFMKGQIWGAIALFADVPYGGGAKRYQDIYFAYK